MEVSSHGPGGCDEDLWAFKVSANSTQNRGEENLQLHSEIFWLAVVYR